MASSPAKGQLTSYVCLFVYRASQGAWLFDAYITLKPLVNPLHVFDMFLQIYCKLLDEKHLLHTLEQVEWSTSGVTQKAL